MQEVPTMVSSKDLSYIEDMLNWNFITIKKINAYLEYIQDEDVEEMLENCSETLKTHYSSILNSLNVGGSND